MPANMFDIKDKLLGTNRWVVTCMPVYPRQQRVSCCLKSLEALVQSAASICARSSLSRNQKNMALEGIAWSTDIEEKLIDLWQERPCLYDASTKAYSNRQQKKHMLGNKIRRHHQDDTHVADTRRVVTCMIPPSIRVGYAACPRQVVG